MSDGAARAYTPTQLAAMRAIALDDGGYHRTHAALMRALEPETVMVPAVWDPEASRPKAVRISTVDGVVLWERDMDGEP